MPTLARKTIRFTCSVLLCLCALLSPARAQQKQPPPQPQQQADDVVRINTELIQTDVTVFDKQGRFVDNLRREQFELLVDGKPQPITFFERVTAGSTSEETQLAAARGQSITQTGGTVTPLDRGRTVIFFIDDLHMTPDSLIRTRRSLEHFVEKEMEQNDQVLITSAAGQIGFLQQLSDSKIMLRAAINRLKSSTQALRDNSFPPMSEALALAIEVYNDRDVIKYFVDAMRQNSQPGGGGQLLNGVDILEGQVRARARRILEQSYAMTRNTLATLESLSRSSARIPGRKLIFFISDGFLVNYNQSDMTERMRNITNAAAGNGVVIYSIDPRGLAVTGVGDADTVKLPTVNLDAGDMGGVFARYTTGDLAQTQEPLRSIAANTGGRALLNTNSLDASFTKAIRETSVYYLLAWRPQTEALTKDKFRQVEVRVTGRPELRVQVRRGYYDVATKPTTVKTEKVEAPKASTPKTAVDEDLRTALRSHYALNALPTQVGLVYVDTPDKGTVLTASIQVARQFMTFNHSEDKQTAVLDLMGVVLNDQGKPVSSFKDRLDVAVYFPQYVGPPRRDLVYNFQSRLAPGLYQVRVAARDQKSGRTGSALQWIEIPNLSERRLSMSSLLLGETTKEAQMWKSNSTDLATAMLSVDRRLPRSSRLRLLTYIYNASRGSDGLSSPDVGVQVQILRDGQPVMTTPQRRIEINGQPDLARLAYAAEVPLEGLLPGRYALLVTVIDRINRTSASQRANFEVE